MLTYTAEEIEAKKQRYPWWKDDMKYPVPESLCKTCTYRCETKSNGLCNYNSITNHPKPVNITLPHPPYCPCYEKGNLQKAFGAENFVVKRGKNDGD